MVYYGFQNQSNLYWAPPQEFETQIKTLDLKTGLVENDLGFVFDIPRRDPVSTPWYFGENAFPDNRELSFSSYPEMFSVDNTLPTVAGYPRVNPGSFAASISRSRNVVRI